MAPGGQRDDGTDRQRDRGTQRDHDTRRPARRWHPAASATAGTGQRDDDAPGGQRDDGTGGQRDDGTRRPARRPGPVSATRRAAVGARPAAPVGLEAPRSGPVVTGPNRGTARRPAGAPNRAQLSEPRSPRNRARVPDARNRALPASASPRHRPFRRTPREARPRPAPSVFRRSPAMPAVGFDRPSSGGTSPPAPLANRHASVHSRTMDAAGTRARQTRRAPFGCPSFPRRPPMAAGLRQVPHPRPAAPRPRCTRATIYEFGGRVPAWASRLVFRLRRA